ncbi:helicase-associated domain-containing protein [Diaminobutyricibacter tongyongensis]|uniref:Helicase-associated domain-containing protein n=1 Tax=Leifsonia tongyongensis TaxID=1268043 RepID=A0A6L9XRP8_9MICO|nr:helicase-associated domain-containing protein [Diaminobutyricibacter tongyongensis]NEN04253.1 helicase-associated domain-containing protein [Diaminobutyricibacter tongyongensis]
MTSTLVFAARLRALDDDALAAALAVRGTPRYGIDDFFDLADALLDRESVQRALAGFDRPTLAVLAALTASGAPATAQRVADLLYSAGAIPPQEPDAVAARLDVTASLLLTLHEGDTYSLYDGVRAQLESWPELGLPSPAELISAPPPHALAPVPDTEQRFSDRLASERAFLAVSTVTELVSELQREGARELQKGGLALPATKRIAAALGVDVTDVATVVSIAARAGLIGLEHATWLPTDAGALWQQEPTADRWRVLASAWRDALPADLRSVLADRAHAVWGERLHEFVDWAYPAAGDAMRARVTAYTRDAEWLGITARQAPSSAGTLLLESGPGEAATAFAALFPPEVDHVYLQHDLTIVSPGPLTPAVDARLRMLADVESRALASTYRVSSASLVRAIAEGETAETIRAFLAQISLTGLPQPLDYLIADAAERYGRVRVADLDAPAGDRETGAHTLVQSDDTALLTTIAVDQALRPIALVRTAPTRLVSRFPRDVVFWALSDARYPVAAIDTDGAIVGLHRHRVAPTAPPPAPNPAKALVERLRAAEQAEGPDTGAQWLARQLDIAIRGKATVTVSVAMPDGRVVEYLLEPTGLGGGRLRGRDRQADIERTLPLSSIRGLSPAEAAASGETGSEA